MISIIGSLRFTPNCAWKSVLPVAGSVSFILAMVGLSSPELIWVSSLEPAWCFSIFMCITKQATKTIHLCTASDPTTACSRARLCTQLLVTSNWLWAKIKKCCMYLSCALDLLSLYVSLQHEQGKREESVPLQCTHWLTAHENTPAVDQPGSEWVSGWVSEYRWVSGWVSEWVGEWVNEWVSEWVSEWVNIGEWVGEWVSEWVS